ncbi:MAG: hypothetical protein K8I30_11495, partial [Anaerolineae bacterium]|nr:hypothetical protein [Anaerolineae bacterium]
ALELHQQRRHVDAAKALGIALQKDHASEPDPRLAELARLLTGKPPKAAIAMLREPFQREKYILESRAQRARKRKSGSDQLWGIVSRFWSVTALGVATLLLISLLVGYLLATATAPSSPIFMLIGLIVGVLLSTGFVYYRLKSAG